MGDYISFNGQFLESGTPLVGAGNRGLRYGDGLFETMRYADEQIQMADAHFERMFHGLQLLSFHLPAHFTTAWLSLHAAALCKKNGHANARVRINIIRGNGGLYDAENHEPNCIIESWALPGNGFEFNHAGLVTGIYPDALKTMDQFSNCKHNNYLAYTMAALYAQKQQWNDVLVLNAARRICDASIANVFMVKDDIVYTCPLSEGCVAGVMRQFILKQLPALDIPVVEKAIDRDDLLAAGEVFLTNAVQGIRWVSHCETSVYNHQLSSFIFDKLLKK